MILGVCVLAGWCVLAVLTCAAHHALRQHIARKGPRCREPLSKALFENAQLRVLVRQLSARVTVLESQQTPAAS